MNPMDRLRWRLVRVDDRLVRVLQYWEPGEDWRDIFATDSEAKFTFPQVSDCSPGLEAQAVSARVIDFAQYRARRKR